MHVELDQLEKKIHAQAGKEFNINSPKQLGDILYDTLGLKPKNQKRTSTGQRSTRESELEKLVDEHPIIKEILRYRELGKLVGTYVDTIPDNGEGRWTTPYHISPGGLRHRTHGFEESGYSKYSDSYR